MGQNPLRCRTRSEIVILRWLVNYSGQRNKSAEQPTRTRKLKQIIYADNMDNSWYLSIAVDNWLTFELKHQKHVHQECRSRRKGLQDMHGCTISIHPGYLAAESHGPATDINFGQVCTFPILSLSLINDLKRNTRSRDFLRVLYILACELEYITVQRGTSLQNTYVINQMRSESTVQQCFGRW